MKKKVLCLVIAVLCILSFAGCSMATVNEDRDRAQVVATVGNANILKGNIIDQTISMLTQTNIMLEDVGADVYQAYYEGYMGEILETEIEYEVLLQLAKELGTEIITEEQEKDLADQKQKLYDNTVETITESVNEDETVKEDEKEAVIEKKVEAKLEKYGYYNGAYEKMLMQTYVKTNVEEALKAQIAYTEDDIKEYYQKNLDEQKKVLDEKISVITDYESEGFSLYVPDGLRYVRSILIALPEDVQTELRNLRNTDNDEDDEKADELRAEEPKKIKDKADEAYAAAKVDFDAALEKYGEDPGMTEEPAKTEGYRIYEGKEDFDSIYVNAGLELKKIGEISNLVESDFGYYIIQLVSEVPSETKSFEEMKEKAEEKYLAEKEEDQYTKQYSEMKESLTIKKYEDRLISE